MTSLQDRIVQLEKQNRRTKRLLLTAMVCLGSVPLLGFATSASPTNASFDVVYASKFVVRDPRTGATRATLAHQTAAGGWAGITLWDNAGQPRAEFKLWEDGRSHLMLMNEAREELSLLSVSPSGEAKLGLGGKTLLTGSGPERVIKKDTAKSKR